jgi:transposase-like protein
MRCMNSYPCQSSIAEMYLKGVSTRKVVAITEQLCGLAIQ